MVSRGKIACAFAALVLLAVCRSNAEGVKIGDPAPKWSGLIGIDDKLHSLDDHKDAKVIVLVFTCNSCPIAAGYEDRIRELAKDYKAKGVDLIACNVNTIPADRLDKMKVRAQEKDFNFPYLYDESQKIAHDYGARVTPHVFILDKDRKVVYIGAIDDDNNAKQAKKTYARDALDALLDGKTIAIAETEARGCTVKYK